MSTRIRDFTTFTTNSFGRRAFAGQWHLARPLATRARQ